MPSEYEVECPMPDCTDALYVTWFLNYGLSPTDTAPSKPEDHHSGSWKIECAAGHMILLPGDTGCGCEITTRGCEHDNTDEYDWSDDYRTIREHDMARLRDVISRLSDTDLAIASS